jgi:AcrR family transcriptional regulator
VPRSGAEARRRLQQAALDLYRERGFDRTTTAEIAARAGVNERTFFRHFPDKREVLFGGEEDLRAALVHEVTTAPDGLAPYEILLHAFRKSARVLEDNRAYAEPRLDLIAKTPALRERDLAKAAYLSEALTEALRARGVPDRLADLAARTGWAAFHHAAQSWLEGQASLDACLRQTFKDLQALHNQ